MDRRVEHIKLSFALERCVKVARRPRCLKVCVFSKLANELRSDNLCVWCGARCPSLTTAARTAYCKKVGYLVIPRKTLSFYSPIDKIAEVLS